jgi:hypothetical protein
LTIAMDLFTRCIVGLQLTPVSTKAIDIANVLFQAVTPQPVGVDGSDGAVWPFHGVPHHVLVGTEEPDGVSQQREGGLPACLPESIVVDNGRQYMSAHVIGACARLGISVQPAIPKKPTDKPTVERFFRTLRESLLQHLPAYKGPDVFSRGKNVEGDAFYYIGELDQIIREWVGIGVPPHQARGVVYTRAAPGAILPSRDVRNRFGALRITHLAGETGLGVRVLGCRLAHHSALWGRNQRPALRRRGAEWVPKCRIPLRWSACREVAVQRGFA